MDKYTKGNIILIIMLVIVILGFIAFNIWAFINYGDKPMHEVPSWINWLMLGR